MHKFLVGVVLSALMLGVVVHMSRAQVATANIKANEIRQGDVLNMDISVNRAPNLDGSISVRVGPDGENDQLTLSCGLPKEATRCQAGARMSLDAKIGKWTIRKIIFASSAPGPEKELAKNGDLSFQVAPHGEVILPDSATISDIK